MRAGWVLTLALWPTTGWATDFVVTNTDDTGPGTLRQAIDDANGDPGGAPHLITFALGGPATIELANPLPSLNVPATIDGIANSPTASCSNRGTPHTIDVQVRATYGTDDSMLRSTRGFTVRGLALVGFEDEAIFLQGPVDGSRIQCNYFGVQRDNVTAEGASGSETIRLLDDGVTLPSDVVIGTDGDGTADDQEWNLFAAAEIGIALEGPDPITNPRAGGTGIVIAGNLFGLSADGSAPPVEPDGTTPLGMANDVLRVEGPYRGLQIGQPCDGTGIEAQGNVFGWFRSDGIDISGGSGADELCVAGNAIHLTADGDAVGDPVADSGVELDGIHTGLQVVDNRFARLNTAVRIRGDDRLTLGEGPTGLRVAGNRFGDPTQRALGVRRAVDLQRVPGAVVEDNEVYGGPDAPDPFDGAGVALIGAEALVQGNLFDGLLDTSTVLLEPWYGNTDPFAEALTPDDLLSVATVAGNTFTGCDQPILGRDVPVDPLADNDGAALVAANTFTDSPTGVAVLQTWRVQPEMAAPPTTPVAWHVEADPRVAAVLEPQEPFLLAELDNPNAVDAVTNSWFLSTVPADDVRNVLTWPLLADYARTVDDTFLPATWTEGCGTQLSADGDPTTDPTDSGIGLSEGTATDWTLTNGVFGTALSTPGDRYQSAELVECACGNGFLDATEACDDGNLTPNDGCTGCTVDAGHVCATLPLQPTGVDPTGARALHDSQDPAWFVGAGDPAYVWDPEVCSTPDGWARLTLGPAQANWLSSATLGACAEAFPDDTPTTFSQSILVDDAVRGPSIASVWVATDDVLDAVAVDGAPVATTGDPTYSRFVRVTLPTRPMAAGPATLSFTMTDTGGQGGFLAFPGPSACGPDTDGDGVGDSGDDDSDNDGVPDIDEGVEGADPTDDHDLDGVIDAEDPDAPGFVDSDSNGIDDRLDVDGDGVPDHRDDDSDNDGLLDADEDVAGTDPRDPDTDDGGATDADEVAAGTDPLDPSDDLPDTGLPPDTGPPTDTGTEPTGPETGPLDTAVPDTGTDPTTSEPLPDAPWVDGATATDGCGCGHGTARAPWWTLWIRRR